jgi:hypothetical protein
MATGNGVLDQTLGFLPQRVKKLALRHIGSAIFVVMARRNRYKAPMRVSHLSTNQRFLWCELIVLTVGVPALLYFLLPPRYILSVMWLAALYCAITIGLFKRTRLRTLWKGSAVTWEALTPILKRFVLSALLMAAATAYFKPELLFRFVRELPHIWIVVMFLYPVLSVIPQEIIYRSFLFARYAAILPKSFAMVMVSGVTFGLSHILFNNWIAPLLCVIGGIMFAQTYAKRPSLALVSIEHALYGCFLFTLGLGHFFYHGAVH